MWGKKNKKRFGTLFCGGSQEDGIVIRGHVGLVEETRIESQEK